MPAEILGRKVEAVVFDVNGTFFPHTLDKCKFLSPNPELASMLSQLHSSLQVGVLTSITEHAVGNTFDALLGPDWIENFHNIHCLNTPGVNWHKPQPEAFRHILVTLGVPPERAIMVGDHPTSDLIPAALLGMLTVQVGRTDYPKADLYLAQVTDLINHLKLS
jgi:beta-phosphoglucomutase-like phosphatase (HAD superfamily)